MTITSTSSTVNGVTTVTVTSTEGDLSPAGFAFEVQTERAQALVVAMDQYLNVMQARTDRTEKMNVLTDLMTQMAALVPPGQYDTTTQLTFAGMPQAQQDEWIRLSPLLLQAQADAGVTVGYPTSSKALNEQIKNAKTVIDGLTQSNELDKVRLFALRDKADVCYETMAALLRAQTDILKSIMSKM